MSVGDQDDSIAATTPQNGSTKREKESTPPLPSNSSSSKTSKRPRKTRQPDVGQQVTKEKTVAGHPYGCNTCAERKGTLSELREHLKTVHTTALDDLEKPYRCAGCHRTYKNPNGLKYHVSVSMVDGEHLTAVRSRGRPSKAPAEPPAFLESSPYTSEGGNSAVDQLAALAEAAINAEPAKMSDPELDGETDGPVLSQQQQTVNGPQKEMLWCPIPGCKKQYRQLSGLRYHLAYGHYPHPDRRQLQSLDPVLTQRLFSRGDFYAKLAARRAGVSLLSESTGTTSEGFVKGTGELSHDMMMLGRAASDETNVSSV